MAKSFSDYVASTLRSRALICFLINACAITSDCQQAYKASEIPIPLVAKLTLRSLENSDKQHMLSQVVGLASNTAAAALHAEKGPLLALDFLEHGRSVLAT
jgi:hypothetical protein